MRVLSIGTDREILNPLSESAKRQVAYGEKFDETHIIVFSRGLNQQGNISLSIGVHAYATRSKSRLWYGFDAIRIARKLPKPDIVTAQDPFETGLTGWIIARTCGAALHVQVHTDFFAPGFRRTLLNRLRVRIARFVLARADRIRVVSNRIKESLEAGSSKLEASISVLPIYTDIEKFRSAHAGVLAGRFAKFQTRLLVVSRLEKEKNVMLAIESFARLPEFSGQAKAADYAACLIIVGEGKERRVLEKRAARLGLASRIFFEGKTDALPYYALADCVLMPSRYEGYGLVIIEALAAGKPVIATDVGIAREAGAIVTDAEHFADSLKEWLERGPREGILRHYPYRSFEEYVQKYCDDITSTASLHAK